MNMKMWAVVDRKDNRIVLVERGYWTIINRFKAGRAPKFYKQHPDYRIKKCTVTIP